MSSPSGRPNFLVVIYDALRASDFPGGSNPAAPMPFTESLLRESIRFPRAAAVAPWTIPSHASVFTGLYPWEHGCHARKSLILDAGVRRLPSVLGAAGYRTLLLSANTLVCPRFGLTEGFQDAAWGGWWESYLRRASPSEPPSTLRGEQEGAELMGRFRDGPLGKLVINSTEAMYRYPFLFDAADLLHQRIRGTHGGRDPSMSPWIEGELDRWMRAQPAEDPVFCAVNLCDTHEPYFVPEDRAHGFRTWWGLARVRQDFVRCISGEWKPTPEEFATLHDLYRNMVRNTDRRLARMVESFRRAGRWDDTVVILTSDHGQAFGEHGELFHLNGVVDAMLRIPLVYRPAGGKPETPEGLGWASLIDIAPTVLEDAGLSGLSTPSARSLHLLTFQERDEPVYAASDGLVWSHLKRVVPEERKAEFDRIRIVAYSGSTKLVRDSTLGRTTAFDLAQDPGEQRDCYPVRKAEFQELEERAEKVGGQMLHSVPLELSPEIEERLKSWGYL